MRYAGPHFLNFHHPNSAISSYHKRSIAVNKEISLSGQLDTPEQVPQTWLADGPGPEAGHPF
jgi:hypothetical protein